MRFPSIIAFLLLGVLLSIPILICAKVSIRRERFGDNYVSAIAGVLAGCVFYTVYALWQSNNYLMNSLVDEIVADGLYRFTVNLFTFCGGFFLGMYFLALIYKYISSPYIGVLNLLLTLVALIALDNFCSIVNSRVFVNYFVLSVGGGVLIHVILNPKPLKELLS